jgi:membrane-anchored protein YejM (alkaline phosphatase superfamily)
VLAPQSSHAPFQKPPGIKLPEDADDESLIQANAIWQFRLIEKIIKKLEDNKSIKKTSIIITGDHGIRSAHESKQLFSNPHYLNPITFHVPLWIIDDSLVAPLNIDIATSHIDITPTILDLIGIQHNPLNYHGRSVWENVEDRYVFFLGGDYLPVSGFTYKKRFFMENRLKNLVDTNDTFLFDRFDDRQNNAIDRNKKFSNTVDPSKALLLVKSLLIKESDVSYLGEASQ